MAALPARATTPPDLTRPDLFARDRHEAIFDALRRDDPVYHQAESDSGPFWNITRHADVALVDTQWQTFSSRDISLVEDMPPGFDIAMFLAMNPPRHTAYREGLKALFSSANIARMEAGIRERTARILDELPVGETFDWVERVAVEVTSFVLASLFDFPFEERSRLIEWSDLAVLKNSRIDGSPVGWEHRQQALMACLARFNQIRDSRPAGADDLVSVLSRCHGQTWLRPSEFLGNLLLMIVAGNDTTRNSITGGVLAMSRFPRAFDAIRQDRSRIPSAVAEIFRWQSPVAYMRRTAAHDTVLGGKSIREGDKVLIWYASANRDESVFPDPHAFLLDRVGGQRHLAFGVGVHRCIGLRLAEMQLRVLWEELMLRFERIEVTGEPVYLPSTFIKGYSHLPVRLHPVRSS